MTTLFQHPNLEIFFNPELRILELRWSGFPAGPVFRELATAIIDAIRQTAATRILSDNTDWKMISPNDHGWAATHWFPKAETAGVKKLATIQSPDIFHVASQRNIENMAEVTCMQTANFKSRSQAEQWLLQKETACVP